MKLTCAILKMFLVWMEEEEGGATGDARSFNATHAIVTSQSKLSPAHWDPPPICEGTRIGRTTLSNRLPSFEQP
jgi:hypothetical protein